MTASTRRTTLALRHQQQLHPPDGIVMPRRRRLLPVELLVFIFQSLTLKDICQCSLYHIALARVGAIDGPLNSLTTAQRIARLEAQERAWLYVSPSRKDIIRIPRRFSSFDLCGGVLVGARAPTTPPPAIPTPAIEHEPQNGAVATASASTFTETNDNASTTSNASSVPDASDLEDMHACEMIGMHLPSVIGDRPKVETWVQNVGFPVFGLTVDPSQDLAVLIEARQSPAENVRVHLMSLSSFSPHPSAAQPILEIRSGDGSFGIPNLSARCMDNLMGVLLNCYEGDESRQTLHIWDWKTGNMRACLDSMKEGRMFDDFSFLTPDTIIIPVRKPAPATLDVYKIEPYSRRSGRLGRNSPAPIPFRITTFELPEMRSPLRVSVNPITCNSDPLPSLTSRLASPRRTSRHQPFYLDPSKALLSFSFMVCHGHTQVASPVHERFTLLVQRKALVEHVERIIGPYGKKPFARQTTILPWTNWGPHSSRFLVEKHISWACFVYGTRVVLAPPASTDRSKCRIKVLDFNPCVVAMERVKQRRRVERKSSFDDEGEDPSDSEDEQQSEADVTLVDLPGVIPSGKVFKNDVTSQLPYREVTSRQAYNFASVIIDEERLGGLVINESRDLCAVEILTM